MHHQRPLHIDIAYPQHDDIPNTYNPLSLAFLSMLTTDFLHEKRYALRSLVPNREGSNDISEPLKSNGLLSSLGLTEWKTAISCKYHAKVCHVIMAHGLLDHERTRNYHSNSTIN